MRRRVVLTALGVGVAGAVGVIVALDVVPGGGGGRADPGAAEQVAVGAAVYAEHCAPCHGADLEGQPDWQTPLATGGYPAPPHDETGHTWHHADALLFRYTKEGGRAVAGPDFESNMPGFGDVLSDAEIWAVLAYIKSRWPPGIRERQAELTAMDR